MKGTCKICGCTEYDPCIHPDFGACWWINSDQDLCSHCIELKEDPKVIRPKDRIGALSWKEPYATLMFHGKIETRTWPTNYRGPVLICTSIKDYRIDQIMNISGEKQFERIIDLIDDKKPEIKNGFAIATGSLMQCRPMQKSDEDKCFVWYSPDLFCHIYKDVRPIKPFPFKGGRKWSSITNEQFIKIKYFGYVEKKLL